MRLWFMMLLTMFALGCAGSTASLPPSEPPESAKEKLPPAADEVPLTELATMYDFDTSNKKLADWMPIKPPDRIASEGGIMVFTVPDMSAYVIVQMDVRDSRPPIVAIVDHQKAFKPGPGEKAGRIVQSDDGNRAYFTIDGPHQRGAVTVRRMTARPNVNMVFLGRWQAADHAKREAEYRTLVAAQKLEIGVIRVQAPDIRGWAKVSPAALGIKGDGFARLSSASGGSFVAEVFREDNTPTGALEDMRKNGLAAHTGPVETSADGVTASMPILPTEDVAAGTVICRTIPDTEGLLLLVTAKWPTPPPDTEPPQLRQFTDGVVTEVTRARPLGQ